MSACGFYGLPINWRDWRFGVVVRGKQHYHHGGDLEFCFGPLAFGFYWRRWR